MKNEIIKNVDNIKVSANELLINEVLNRNFRKLFENDQALLPISGESGNLYRILPYQPGKVYAKNDLVWFVDYYLSPQNEKLYNTELNKITSLAAFQETEIDQNTLEDLKNQYYTVSLYLLRSLKSNNDSFPKREIIDMVPKFDASGWKNENPFGSIYTDFFDEFTAYTLKNQLEKMHETVESMHKFGKLSSYSDLDGKVLRTDLENLSPNRSSFMFPKHTVQLEPNGSILDGWVRIWDTGYIEYDIIFKLGSTGTNQVYNPDGTLRTIQTLKANQLSLKPTTSFSSEVDQYNNRNYYWSEEDSEIFRSEGQDTASVNGITQTNLNKSVNVFHGTIVFDQPFSDTNYCIFTESNPCVATSGSEVQTHNVNTIVFTNKSKHSVTPVLIVPSYNGTNPKILTENKFRCHICGRWKN